MASPTRESPNKLSASKKKFKEKSSNSGNLLKGSGSNAVISSSSSGCNSKLETEMSAFQNLNDPASLDGKISTGYMPETKGYPTEVGSGLSGSSKSKKKSDFDSNASQESTSNPGHREGGRRSQLHRSGRSFSSCSSDEGEENGKSRARLLRNAKCPKPPVVSDDEATDSADEGNSGGEEGEKGKREGSGIHNVAGLRRCQHPVSRKDSSESTNSATSPIDSSALATSTIFIESALPKEPLMGPNGLTQPSSPVNMAVGYGPSNSIAPPPAVFDKTPTQSPLGTPTLDSPKTSSNGPASPGTPIPSPEVSESC